jgi:hypothetical protein
MTPPDDMGRIHPASRRRQGRLGVALGVALGGTRALVAPPERATDRNFAHVIDNPLGGIRRGADETTNTLKAIDHLSGVLDVLVAEIGLQASVSTPSLASL